MNKMYLIIPGIGGSKIYCNCGESQIRLYPSIFSDLNEHFFEPEKCTVTTKPLRRICRVPIYYNLEKRLKRHNKIVQYFSYDWRRDPLTVAKLLVVYLDNLTAAATTTTTTATTPRPTSIHIIGHSNGGFIARILLEYLQYSNHLIKSLMICGTPLYGFSHLTLYNREYALYNKLCHSTEPICGKIKLLSKNDLEKIFHFFKSTLIYYIPTYMFEIDGVAVLSLNTSVPISDVFVASQVHRKLKTEFDARYIFFFNVSQKTKQKMPFDARLPDAVFNFHRLVKNKNLITTTTHSDTVVCTPSFPLMRTIYDNTPLNHSLMMNSKFLANVILKRT